MVVERDFTKFLKEGERLNIRLVPRDVYVEMIKRHRSNPAVVDEVFDDLFWLWDLNALVKSADDEGRTATRIELADELIAEMSDDDWWQTIAGFEEHLIGNFSKNLDEWTEFLDPVYDMQERDGWIQRQ